MFTALLNKFKLRNIPTYQHIDITSIYELHYYIKRVFKALDKIPNLNYGGCAIAAYAVLQHLKKYDKNIDAEVVYLYDIDQFSTYNDALNNYPNSCIHAVLRVGNLYYDSEGACLKDYLEEHYTYLTPVSEEYVLTSINMEGRWNYSFNRKKGLLKIKKILGEDAVKDIAIF